MEETMMGLDIDLEAYEKMDKAGRDKLLFKNVLHIRESIADFQLHKKVFYIWISALTLFVGVKRFLGI